MIRGVAGALVLAAGAAALARTVLRREVDVVTVDGQRLLLAPWSPEAAEIRRRARGIAGS